jgi:hypothetical protein
MGAGAGVGGGAGRQRHAVNITNEAALHSVAEVGGIQIATNRDRSLDFEDGLTVTIEPLIVLFDFDTVLQRLDKELFGDELVAQKDRGTHV